jgi:hypothetical protein
MRTASATPTILLLSIPLFILLVFNKNNTNLIPHHGRIPSSLLGGFTAVAVRRRVARRPWPCRQWSV